MILQCLQIKAHLQVSSSDYDSLQQRCNECRATLNLLEQLVQVSDGFRDTERLIASKSYVEATQLHASVYDVLTDISQAYGNELIILPSLICRHDALEEKLETHIKQRWTELVAWSISPVILTIASGPDSHAHLQRLSQALHNLRSLSPLISKFAGQIMTEFVRKILPDSVNPSCDPDVTQDSLSVSIKVIADRTPANASSVTRTLRKLSMFTTLMELLYENLLNITVIDDIAARQKTTKDIVLLAGDEAAAAAADTKTVTSSGDAKPSRRLMSMFGRECSVACLQALIDNCLSSAIPSHRSELAEFTQVIDLKRCLLRS